MKIVKLTNIDQRIDANGGWVLVVNMLNKTELAIFGSSHIYDGCSGQLLWCVEKYTTDFVHAKQAKAKLLVIKQRSQYRLEFS